MTNLLLILRPGLPEAIRNRYPERLHEIFPQIHLTVVDSAETAATHMPATDILMTYAATVKGADLLKGAARLKWIQSLTTGMDGIIDQPSLRPDVIVTSMRGIHGPPVAEATLMAMLALARNLPQMIRNQRAQQWERPMPRLLYDRTVGILGIGVIGQALAPRCKALGMTVIGITSAPRKVEGFDRIYRRDALIDAVRDVDFLVLLTPYSKETHHIAGRGVLAAMKRESFLINVGRGRVVDEAALIDALNEGRLAGAALDVFPVEPLPAGHPFWSMPNVLVTPHLAGVHDQYAEHALPIVEENLRLFLAGDFENMINLVPH